MPEMTNASDALRLIESVTGRRYEELTEEQIRRFEREHELIHRNARLQLMWWRPRAEDAR